VPLSETTESQDVAPALTVAVATIGLVLAVVTWRSGKGFPPPVVAE